MKKKPVASSSNRLFCWMILFFQRGNVAGILAEFFGFEDAAHDFA
jgi:hypothetical protein